MNEPFAVIFQFLDQFEPQVTGHSYEAVEPALKATVRAFARGELPTPERDELIQRLLTDTNLLALLSTEVKTLRKPGADPDAHEETPP